MNPFLLTRSRLGKKKGKLDNKIIETIESIITLREVWDTDNATLPGNLLMIFSIILNIYFL